MAVGRPESPLDPHAGPIQQLAWQLRRLREAAGRPSYRRLALQAHFSSTTLANAAKGERLPSLEVTVAYAVACGGDRAEWEARWRAAAEPAAAGSPPGPAAEQCPYLGLAAYQEADADRFFGREQLVERVVGRIAEQRIVAVSGASGSGKSSLLRAGVAPALRAGANRRVVLFTPGDNPLSECAVRVGKELGLAAGALLAELTTDADNLGLAVRQALAGDSPSTELVLIVDQFEEVFAYRCGAHRDRFIQTLVASATAAGSRTRVVLGVRDDVVSRCEAHPELSGVLRGAWIRVAPMSPDELVRAISEPARRAELMVERTLVTTIVDDATERPGQLPLVSQALLETWGRRRGTALTLAGYHEAGGVRGVVTRAADQMYGELDDDRRAVARDILLRLTTYGGGATDTRRRVSRDELGHGPVETEILHRLAAARLVTLREDTVEMAHEALIRCWPVMSGWLTNDRPALLAHRHLTTTAAEWHDSGHSDHLLYRGARLAAWDDRAADRCNDLERAFLSAARRRAAAARVRVRLGAAALVATILVVTSLTCTTLALTNRIRDEQDRAYAAQLAAKAKTQLPFDPELALLLAIHAFETKATPETEAVLRQATVTSRRRATLQASAGGAVTGIAFSADGALLAGSGRDGSVQVWQGSRPVAELRGHQGPAWGVAFSADDRWLASAGDDGTVRVRQWRTGREVVLHGHTGSVRAVAFDPAGDRLASGGADGTVRVWDLSTGRATVWPAHQGQVNSVAFSADGRRLAAAHADGTVSVWSGQGLQRRLAGHVGPVRGVAFSPDGQHLASAGEDGTARIWDLAAAEDSARVLSGHDGVVEAVAFSPDGRSLATGGQDGTIRIWRTFGADGPLSLRGHRGPVMGVAFDPGGGHDLVAAGTDGTVSRWDTSGAGNPLILGDHLGRVWPVRFSPDGTRIASGGDDGTVRLWSTTDVGDTVALAGPGGAVTDVTFGPDGRRLVAAGSGGTIRVWQSVDDPAPSTVDGHQGAVWAVAISPDGRRLAAGGQDGTVRVWTGEQEPLVLRGHDRDVNTVAFSPDGRRLASGGDDGTVRLWDLTGGPPLVLHGHEGGVRGVAFSPDGRRLASSGNDGTVRLWDTTGGGPVVLLGHEGMVWSVAFSADGRHLASSGEDGTVRIWTADAPEPVVIDGFASSVGHVEFAPDGHTLATAHGDGTTRIWNCETCQDAQRVLALARTRVTRSLTAEERAAFLGRAP